MSAHATTGTMERMASAERADATVRAMTLAAARARMAVARAQLEAAKGDVVALQGWLAERSAEAVADKLTRLLDLMMTISKGPRLRMARLVMSFGGIISLWLRPHYWPAFRWRQRDRSLAEFTLLGLTLLVSLPPNLFGGTPALKGVNRDARRQAPSQSQAPGDV